MSIQIGALVDMSNSATFTDFVTAELTTFPVNDADTYTGKYFKQGKKYPSIALKKFARHALKLPAQVPVPVGCLQINEIKKGQPCEVSATPDFAESMVGKLYDQQSDGQQNHFSVLYQKENNDAQYAYYGFYARLPQSGGNAVTQPTTTTVTDINKLAESRLSSTGTPATTQSLNETADKSQLYGLLTQLTNLINNQHDTAAAARSVANLYGKPAEVLNELSQIRLAVKAWDGK